MRHVKDPVPVPTDIIRTPAAGPEPANTLAFVRCRGSGADIAINRTDLVRFEVEFRSKFTIDGYLQQKHDWYLRNTVVSATGMIRLMSTTTDMEFVMAMDSVDPFIDLDGVLGFNCQVALQIDGLGLLERGAGIDCVFDISAYVLLYEPRADLPPSGNFGQTWRHDPGRFDFALADSANRIRSGGSGARLALNLKRHCE